VPTIDDIKQLSSLDPSSSLHVRTAAYTQPASTAHARLHMKFNQHRVLHVRSRRTCDIFLRILFNRVSLWQFHRLLVVCRVDAVGIDSFLNR
jgi:hypothetical protein